MSETDARCARGAFFFTIGLGGFFSRRNEVEPDVSAVVLWSRNEDDSTKLSGKRIAIDNSGEFYYSLVVIIEQTTRGKQ